jgi:hypothetical protein
MLPEAGELELLLGLEARIQAKIVAAGVYGMESEVIEGTLTAASTRPAVSRQALTGLTSKQPGNSPPPSSLRSTTRAPICAPRRRASDLDSGGHSMCCGIRE